jgi:hypothetical protein
MKEKWMFHTVYAKRNRTLPLLGFLLMVLALLGSMLLNQTYLHPTHAASACQGPPAGFDPTAPKVTNAQLEQYGLPPRPSASQKPQEYAFWLKLVQNAKHRVCATSTTSQMAFSGTSAVAPLSMKTANLLHDNYNSGYVAYATGAVYVSGTWKVPCPQGMPTETATMQDRIQVGYPTPVVTVGTQIQHTEGANGGYGTDKDQYFVSYQPPIIGRSTGALADPVDFPIHCGDTVSAQITYDNSVSPAQWNAFIEDTSTNASFSMAYAATLVPNNAFWGDHAVGYPLYKFGSVQWTGDQLSNNANQGDSEPIAQRSNSPVQMINFAGGGMASPTALDITGAGFTDNWQNPS